MIIRDFHPLFLEDVDAMQDGRLDGGGKFGAALQRIHEIEWMIDAIADNPRTGTPLDDRVPGCLVRHGGQGRRITIVFRPDTSRNVVRFLLVAFDGQNRPVMAEDRL